MITSSQTKLGALKPLLAAGALYLGLALIVTYPLVLAPHKANRFNSPDAMLNAWILSWDLDQLVGGRLDLFDANIFYPEENVLAYSENLITAALMVLPLRLITENPILLVNAAFILALVANGLAGFFLARLFSKSNFGAGLAGLSFAFASFHWVHIPQLQLQLAFPLAAAFYFARSMRERPGIGPSVGLALSIGAAFGACGYYAVFLLTALPLFVAADLVAAQSGKRRQVVLGFVAAAFLALLVSLPLLLPYGSKMSTGYRRSLEVTVQHSADVSAYVTSVSKLHFFLEGDEEPFFPGFVVSVLACLAVVRALGRGVHRHDVMLWLLVGLLGVWISLGPSYGLFSILFHLLPPYRGLRVPARAGILFLLAVSVLASFGLARIRKRGLRVALVALAAAECYAGPIPWLFEVPSLPPIYSSLVESDEGGALIELPLPPPYRVKVNARYVYRSIFLRKPLVNGYSGFVPQSYRDAHRLLMKEDFGKGLFAMEKLGVQWLMAHTARLGGRMVRRIDRAEGEGRIELIDEVGPDRLYRIMGE